MAETANAGTDTVAASITYTLGANVENLILTGAANLNGTGNGLSNLLIGNAGNNILNGGAGSDTFVFESMRDGIDTITDFVSGVDRLQLTQTELSGLLAEMRSNGGALSAGRFVANNTGAATNASQRIIYILKTGALYYDADGSGQGVAVQFATLGNKPANLKASDFFTAAS